MADNRTVVQIVLDEKGAVKSLNQFEKKARKVGQNAGDGLESGVLNGLKVVKGAVAGISGLIALEFGRRSIQAFADFEEALIGVSKTTNLTGGFLDSFGEKLQDLSEEIPVSATELAGLAEQAGRFGVSGTKNLLDFTETVAKLQVATDLAGEAGVQALAQILGITGEANDEIGKLGSVVNKLENEFRTSASLIVSAANEVGRATTGLGLASEEVAGIAAGLRDLGIQAESGGTAIGKAFRQIRVAVATNNKNLRVFAKTIGTTTEQLRQDFGKDSLEVFQRFLKGLNAIGSNNAVIRLQELGLSSDRVSKTLLPLIENVDRFNQVIGTAQQEAIDQASLNEEAAKSFSALNKQFDIAVNKITNFATAIGESFAPSIRVILKGFNDVTDAIGGFFGSLESDRVSDAEARVESLQGQLGELQAELEKAPKDEGFIDRIFGRSRGEIINDILKVEASIKHAQETLRAAREEARLEAGVEPQVPTAPGLPAGIDRTSEIQQQQKLTFEYIRGRGELAETKSVIEELRGGFGDFTDFADQNVERLRQRVAALGMQIRNNLVRGVGNAFAAVGKALVKGQNAFDAFGKAILGAFGGIAIQLGQFYLLLGTAQLFTPGGQASGAAQIAAGIGLTILGGALQAIGGGGGAPAATTPTAAGGAAPTSPDFGAPQGPDFGAIEDGEQRAQVNLIVQGNILDRRESGVELFDSLIEAANANGIELGAIA